MEWVGVGMVFVGGILLYSAVRDLSPWQEFLATLQTAKLQGASASSGAQPITSTPPAPNLQLAPLGGGGRRILS